MFLVTMLNLETAFDTRINCGHLANSYLIHMVISIKEGNKDFLQRIKAVLMLM